jgi:hypothetical protein
MRETILGEWTKFRDKVSDNFRVITHENFRFEAVAGIAKPGRSAPMIATSGVRISRLLIETSRLLAYENGKY